MIKDKVFFDQQYITKFTYYASRFIIYTNGVIYVIIRIDVKWFVIGKNQNTEMVTEWTYALKQEDC